MSESNAPIKHPGLIAGVFTVIVLAGFLFAVYSSATGHEGGHGGEHGAASASGSASGAPAHGGEAPKGH